MTSYHNRNYRNWPSHIKIMEERQVRRNKVAEWMLAQTANGEVLYEWSASIAKQCGCRVKVVAAALMHPDITSQFDVRKISHTRYRIERKECVLNAVQ